MKEKTLQKDGDFAFSLRLAAAIHAQRIQCFQNAWRALILTPELRQGCYVEGWWVIETEDSVTMNEHGWVELNGTILDPTVALFGDPTLSVFYFAGVVRSWEETEALENELFPHVRFDGLHGEDGLLDPGYRAARNAARNKTYELAQQYFPPKSMQFLVAQDMESQEQAIVIEGMPLDVKTSQNVASEIGAEPDLCWYNARSAMLQMPAEFFLAHYTEGWMVELRSNEIRVVEHGWISSHRGIVDPTLILDEPPTHLNYFPGFRASWQEMVTLAEASLPLTRWENRNVLEYQEACQKALRYAEALAWQTGLLLTPAPGGVATFEKQGQSLVIGEVFWDFPVPARPSPRIAQFLQQWRTSKELR